MASTYTTGFGIEKIGSGEQAGSWGTTTNHNADILDRIASYKAVALSGTTHTLTVREASPGSGTENLQDGMYRVIKFTGALAANNTVTIAPNTSPAWFIIENATTDSGSSGPYSVILTQGSGANVTVQNGKNAIIYCDGAGSGAVVYDALADLQVGTLEVTGVAAIDGALTQGGASQFNSTVTVGVDDTGYDVKLFGATTGKSLLWDESADSLIVTGTTTLVGTTNLDAVDIDGATQIDGTVTVGVNDTGYDVKLFGATAGSYLLWDESTDDLILGGVSKLGIGATSPGAEIDIESTGPEIHLNDSDGVLGAAITSRVVMQASGSTHGIVGFGTTGGVMAVTNAQGSLYLQADTNDAHTSSSIVLSVDNANRASIDADGIDIVGDVTASTLNADGDTSASDNAAIGYTAAEGLILTGQGSTDDITVKNDADTTVLNVGTGATDVEVSAGNLLFGTAAKGVYLGVTTATAANLLDDYEEGDWTPTIGTGTTVSTDATYNGSYTTGQYTKVGRMVHCTATLRLTAKGTQSGNISILGLPFASANNVKYRATWSSWFHGAADIDLTGNTAGTIMMYQAHNTSYIQVRVKDPATAAGETVQFADISHTVYLQFSGSYAAA
jgi:hypothetical protein